MEAKDMDKVSVLTVEQKQRGASALIAFHAIGARTPLVRGPADSSQVMSLAMWIYDTDDDDGEAEESDPEVLLEVDEPTSDGHRGEGGISDLLQPAGAGFTATFTERN